MIYLLTGGHTGIGLHLSKKLLLEGHEIGLIVRNKERENETLNEFTQKDSVTFFHGDLSIPDDITRLANEIKTKWPTIDGLFNNAGVLLDKAYYLRNGNEIHFQVNTLAPYFLAKNLTQALQNSSQGFVVNTATGGLHRQRKVDIPNLKKPKKFVKLFGSYLSSKLAMLLLMNHLSKELPSLKIVTVDPGPNKTKMTKGVGMPALLLPLRNLFFQHPSKGGALLYKAAFDPKFAQKSGIYISGNAIKKVKLQLDQKELSQILSKES